MRVYKENEDSYYTRCACHSNEHIIDMFNDDGTISLFFKCSYDADTFIERIKGAFKLLFTGSISTDGEFIFKDKIHVKEFIFVLNKLNDKEK